MSAYKKYIRTLVDTLASRMHLQEWNINLKFDAKLDPETAAEIEIDVPYLIAEIFIDKVMRDYYRNKDGYTIAHILTHELSHILVEPIYIFARDAVTNQSSKLLHNVVEQQTQRISRVIDRQLPRSIYEIK